VGKYGTARQATSDNKKGRMRCACWVTKARDAHSEYEKLRIGIRH